MTTFTSRVHCREHLRSANCSRRSRAALQSGSRRRPIDTRIVLGRMDTVRFQLANRSCRVFASTSPTNANIIGSCRFRRNTANCWRGTRLNTTSGMCGIRSVRIECFALTGRHATAQGETLGRNDELNRALKGRDVPTCGMSPFQGY